MVEFAGALTSFDVVAQIPVSQYHSFGFSGGPRRVEIESGIAIRNRNGLWRPRCEVRVIRHQNHARSPNKGFTAATACAKNCDVINADIPESLMM